VEPASLAVRLVHLQVRLKCKIKMNAPAQMQILSGIQMLDYVIVVMVKRW
jgi:hypothetical protein